MTENIAIGSIKFVETSDEKSEMQPRDSAIIRFKRTPSRPIKNSSKSKVDRSTKANKSCQPSKSKINSEKTQKDSSIDKSAPKKYEPTTRKKKEPKKLVDDVATPVAPAKPSKMKVTPMPKSLAVADKGNTVNSKASTFRLLPRPDECWRYSDEFRESQLKLLEKIRARQKATGDYTPRLLDRNYD